jgi:hypothetical protein
LFLRSRANFLVSRTACRKEEGRQRTNSLLVLKSKMRATFINASDKQPVELEVRGDWLDRSATITDLKNGRVVAQISRSRFNMREILGGQQSVSYEHHPSLLYW